MDTFDFAIAWDWEYDHDFVLKLDKECQKEGLQSYLICFYNLYETIGKIARGKLRFKAFFDRASSTSSEFVPLAQSIRDQGAITINDPRYVNRALDKATMHLEFLSKGLSVPYTIILPPLEESTSDDFYSLEHVGIPFVVKPALGGGGVGVIVGAKNNADIKKARKSFKKEKYLIQEKIEPIILGNKRAWFRTFYVGGKVFTCWWDDQTCIYERLKPLDEHKYNLYKLKEIIAAIAEVARLDFFSSEICLNSKQQFIIIDYVNEPCDMRLKSIHKDGVPDTLVDEIVRHIVSLVKTSLSKKRPANLL